MSTYEFNSTKELLGFLKSMKRVLQDQDGDNATSAKKAPVKVGMELEPDLSDQGNIPDDPYYQDRFDASIEIERSGFRYYPKSQTYRVLDGKYKEGSLVALYVEDHIFLVNFDPGDTKHHSAYTPLVVDCLDRKMPRGEADKLYRAAYHYAKRRSDPCAIAICRQGKLLMPCSAFKDPKTGETDYLATIFNAKPCEYNHRQMIAALEVQVGNMIERTFIAYQKGAEINWPAFVYDKISENREQDESFELYPDPSRYLRT